MRQNSEKTKRSLSPVLETRVFEGVQRGPESNNGGSTMRKVLLKVVETCERIVYVVDGAAC